MRTRSAALHTAILIVLPVLWLEACRSGYSYDAKLEEEISKQDSIYQSKGREVPRGYTLNRSLEDYSRALPAAFGRSLANLGPSDRWLDVGAGEGLAILDYYTSQYDQVHPDGRKRRGKKARAVAMSIEDRRTPQWREKAASLESDQIQYLANKRLREYSREELGQFQVITDMVGGFSYTENLSLFMEKVLGFLDLNGSFYAILQDVQSEDGTKIPFYKGSPFLTEITGADGSQTKVCSWLKSIACVKVTCEAKEEWHPPIEAFHVQKVCNDVAVPALTAVHYEAGTPPERRFQLKD